MSSAPARATLATLTLLSAIACTRPNRLAADLIVTHANIWTGDPTQPDARALAVIGERIVDVGGVDAIDRWRGANTTVVDAGGRRLVPGFNDAHVHVVEGGTDLDAVDLTDAGSVSEFARRINERAKAKPGEWILGGHWDDRRWSPASLPTRALIDDVTNSSPVFVLRYDGRAALANSAALGRAGITERTADPAGGGMVRDANGFPTGVLTGTAMDIVAQVIPKMTADQRLHAVKRTLELAASLGITSLQDMHASYDDIAAYADLGVHRAFGSPWLRIGAVQAVGSGIRASEEMRTRLMAADHAELQLCVDAPADGGARPVLDLFDGIARVNGGRDRRFRMEHALRLAPGDADRVAALNAIASIQPEEEGAVNGLRALADKGVRLALGSGWPAAPLNPMLTLSTMTAHRLTVAEALSAHTVGSTFAEFQEGEKGTIARGRLADVIILSDDILSIPPAQIKDVRVLTTIVGGRIVHQRKPQNE